MILFNLFFNKDWGKSLRISRLKILLYNEVIKKHQLIGLQPIQ